MTIPVFVDSDVIISSLLSSSGAAWFLLHNVDTVHLSLSNLSLQEIRIVMERLHIAEQKLDALLQQNITIVQLEKTVCKAYEQYVLDRDDAHIVAGAHTAQARFLLSYNLKHFKADMIREELDLILYTPATLLQYLRSI